MKNDIKKLYYSIGEVSKMVGLKSYVLRYWETEFKQLSPPKNRAGNRTYRQKDIDLIMGGSPCQGFACQGQQLNFDDPRSKLFFTMVEIIEHYQPKYFLLENVGMRKQWQDIITQYIL